MIDLIKKSNIFEALEPKELEAVAQISKIVLFKEGDQIFKAGDDASSMYIVRTGEVKLKFSFNHLNAPVVLTLDTIKKGGSLGWSAFAQPFKYTLSAYAVGDTQLLRLHSDGIRELCDKNQHLGYVVMKNIATMISARFARLQGLLQHVIQGYLK
ncbi:MAG: cyclic nucleotide-binding domain-containing protein [Candidatus Marinimicrobia bacterium]|nr:cyclic nucleotide-binding domain-containing protein [Candidatus Neomarinimicrobiota bacterium]